MVAARLANLANGSNRFQKVGTSIDVATVTQADAAKKLAVSVPTVQRARAVLKSGSEPLIAAVDEGRLSVSAAASVAAMPPDRIVEEVARAVAPSPVPPPTRRRVDHASRPHRARRSGRARAPRHPDPSTRAGHGGSREAVGSYNPHGCNRVPLGAHVRGRRPRPCLFTATCRPPTPLRVRSRRVRRCRQWRKTEGGARPDRWASLMARTKVGKARPFLRLVCTTLIQ